MGERRYQSWHTLLASRYVQEPVSAENGQRVISQTRIARTWHRLGDCRTPGRWDPVNHLPPKPRRATNPLLDRNSRVILPLVFAKDRLSECANLMRDCCSDLPYHGEQPAHWLENLLVLPRIGRRAPWRSELAIIAIRRRIGA
jgi:hypothetical protein